MKLPPVSAGSAPLPVAMPTFPFPGQGATWGGGPVAEHPILHRVACRAAIVELLLTAPAPRSGGLLLSGP